MEVSIKFDPELLRPILTKLVELGIPVLYTSHNPESPEFILYIEGELTAEQLQTIKDVVISIRLKDIDVYDPEKIRNLTREQLETYIETKVTDFASAKIFLKKLAVFTLYLYKRLMEAETT